MVVEEAGPAVLHLPGFVPALFFSISAKKHMSINNWSTLEGDLFRKEVSIQMIAIGLIIVACHLFEMVG